MTVAPAAADGKTKRPTRPMRARLAAVFDDSAPARPVTQAVNAGIALVIVVNVVAAMLETVEQVRRGHEAAFWWIEQVATVVFAIEYILRVWSAVDLTDRRYAGLFWGRLRYVCSFFALVDLVAVLPGILGIFGASDFRVLRLLRLLRMLKLTRHSTAFGLIWAVFREEARSIAAVLFILVLTLTLSASLMYMVEGAAQPEVFSSIPLAMWWSIETITTVGYGDMVPVSIAGRVLGGIVSIVGIGAVALLSGLITVSFLDQLRLRRNVYRKAVETRLAKGPLSRSEASEIARLGESYGLPESDAIETIDDVVNAEASSMICPRCGLALERHLIR